MRLCPSAVCCRLLAGSTSLVSTGITHQCRDVRTKSLATSPTALRSAAPPHHVTWADHGPRHTDAFDAPTRSASVAAPRRQSRDSDLTVLAPSALATSTIDAVPPLGLRSWPAKASRCSKFRPGAYDGGASCLSVTQVDAHRRSDPVRLALGISSPSLRDRCAASKCHCAPALPPPHPFGIAQPTRSAISRTPVSS